MLQGSRFYLLFVVLCHEALVADVGEEECWGEGEGSRFYQLGRV
jgi:hypothetical protein